MSVYGIYGYGVTREISLFFGKILPITHSVKELTDKITNKDKLELTGFLIFDNVSREKNYIFHLEVVLSFIEQRRVLIRHKLKTHETIDYLDSDYPKSLTIDLELNSRANVIIEDWRSPDSRKTFIDTAMNKIIHLNDEEFIQIIHKNVLTFSNPLVYADVNYYLWFSGLEALARKRVSKYGTDIAGALYLYLNDKFIIKQQCNENPLISIDAYVALRNGIFHNGKLVTELKNRPFKQEVSLKKLHGCFKRLNILSILKDTEFDDGFVNWDFTNYRYTFINLGRTTK